MRGGTPIIAQGALKAGRWGGRLDILRRVEKASAFGEWSDEVIDTKLARKTKGNTVLQISLYSDLLTDAQGLAPEFACVVTPGSGFKPQEFRYSDSSKPQLCRSMCGWIFMSKPAVQAARSTRA
jgi:uncharacterized protein